MKGFLPVSRESRIIDLACGAGHFMYFLQQEGYANTEGIDISNEMLDVARSMGVANCIHADLFQFLPDKKQTYDLIIANDIVEHLEKDEVMNLLDLIHDSLNPGGRVIISTINAMSLFGYGTIQNEYTHVTGFTPMSLVQVLKVCGFLNVVTRGERPVVHDIRSGIRAALWKIMQLFLRFFMTIERGTGRGIWKHRFIMDTRFFAVAQK
jgi:2-polyprenyl-3-methyl-5-hydroxy-6-metoxy-1,4-benzoquinol methylase